MAAIVRQCDYVGDGVYLHLTATTLKAAVEVKAFVKQRPEESYRLVVSISFWAYKSTVLASGSKDPALLQLICQQLMADQFTTHFPQAEKAFSAWQQSLSFT